MPAMEVPSKRRGDAAAPSAFEMELQRIHLESKHGIDIIDFFLLDCESLASSKSLWPRPAIPANFDPKADSLGTYDGKHYIRLDIT